MNFYHIDEAEQTECNMFLSGLGVHYFSLYFYTYAKLHVLFFKASEHVKSLRSLF